MSISKFPAERNPNFIPAGASGSYGFAEPIEAGMYLVETDTTQNISSSDFYVETSEGFRIGAAIRGGQGILAVPLAADTVYVNSGTFPLPLTFESRDYNLIEAPSASINEYVEGSLEVLVGYSSGATEVAQIYWPDGTSASMSGSAASFSIPGGLSAPLNVGVAQLDTNSVAGAINTISVAVTWFEFLSSSVFTIDPAYTSADVYMVAAGGGGAPGNISGGGGGGEWVFAPAVPVSGSVSIVIGAGGAGTDGTATTVGASASAAAGAVSFAPRTGGTSGSGNPGGTGAQGPNPSRQAAGGGGGDTANGNNSPDFVNGGPGGAGKSAPTSIFGVSVGGGGGGGVYNTFNSAGNGGAGVDGGGPGAIVRNPAGTPTGGSAGTNGSANRGGGGGGTGSFASVTGSSGGSGRVKIKLLA